MLGGGTRRGSHRSFGCPRCYPCAGAESLIRKFTTHYGIVERLGGGMGVAYKAEGARLRFFAATGPSIRSRFRFWDGREFGRVGNEVSATGYTAAGGVGEANR